MASSANWPAQNETIPVGNQHAKLLGQKSPISVSSPKAKRKQRTPIQRVIRWGPWHYRFWREIARWCYEQSLHNPAVVPADDGFPAHRQLLESYQQIRQETLEVALSRRLPANHDIAATAHVL